MLRALSVASIALLGALACEGEPEPPPRYPFTFTAHSDGDPLEGVEITMNGSSLGTTNGQGVLRSDLTGPAGAPVRIGAVCPAGHRSPDQEQVQTLRRVQSIDPAAAARGIEVTFTCPPEHRSAVVLVHTHGQTAMPVILDGREIARTDPSGVAHLSVEMAPGTTFQVQLDTRHNERLRPRSPTQTYTVPDHDDVFVLNQRFEEEAPPRRVRRPRPPPPPAVRLPIRIPSARGN